MIEFDHSPSFLVSGFALIRAFVRFFFMYLSERLLVLCSYLSPGLTLAFGGHHTGSFFRRPALIMLVSALLPLPSLGFVRMRIIAPIADSSKLPTKPLIKYTYLFIHPVDTSNVSFFIAWGCILDWQRLNTCSGSVVEAQVGDKARHLGGEAGWKKDPGHSAVHLMSVQEMIEKS